MRFLSPQDAAKIMDVTDKVEHLVKSGVPIHEAFARCVKEANLSHDQAHLAARTWNIGHFLASRGPIREEIGIEETLPLVDFESVKPLIEKTETKKAEAEVAGIYFKPPVRPESKSVSLKHPLFQKYAGASAVLERQFRARQLKTNLGMEIDYWDKLAERQKSLYRQKLAEIAFTVKNDLLPRLKHPDIDLDLARSHLAAASPKAAAVLDRLVKFYNIQPAPLPDHLKKAHYDPKHPIYAGLIKVASLLEEVRQHRWAYKKARAMRAKVFGIYHRCFGLPESEVDKYQVVVEHDDVRLLKNGAYIEKPPLSREVITAGYSLPAWKMKERPIEIDKRAKRQTLVGKKAKKQKGQSSQGSQSSEEDVKEVMQAIDLATRTFPGDYYYTIGYVPFYYTSQKLIEEAAEKIKEKVQSRSKQLDPYFASKRKLENLAIFMTSDPMLASTDPELLREAYRQLHMTAPELMDQPQLALNFLKKYIAQDQTIDTADLVALLRAYRQPVKQSNVKKAILGLGKKRKNPKPIASALTYGLLGSLVPLLYVDDYSTLPYHMGLGGLLGAGLGYTLGKIL